MQIKQKQKQKKKRTNESRKEDGDGEERAAQLWSRKVEREAKWMQSSAAGDLVNSNAYAAVSTKVAQQLRKDAHAREGDLTPRPDDDVGLGRGHQAQKPKHTKSRDVRRER